MALSFDTTIGAGGIIIAEASAASATTASFSTAADVRLVALASGNGQATTTLTVSTSGGGITWTREVQEVTREGGAEIWLAYSASALSSQTVTATSAPDEGHPGVSLTVVALLGAEVTHGGGEATGSNASAVPSVALTSTRDGSYIFATCSDWSAQGNYTVSGSSPAQTLLNTHHIAAEYSGGQSQSTNTVSIGTQTMAYTLSRNYNMCVIEIREVGGPPPPPPTPLQRIGPDRRAGN